MPTMTMTQNSVKSFYNKVLENQIETEENLMSPIHLEFNEIISGFPDRGGYSAIDLGYGYGNYSIALAQKGFKVTAIDCINPDYLKKRLKEIETAGEINILQQDLNLFIPKENYDVVISKDVLHFLNNYNVQELLKVLVEKTNTGGWHYIVIFTDIKRKSDDGHEVFIENEAQLTKDDLIDFIEGCYKGWQVNIKIEPYKEKDNSGHEDSFYFQSNKITIIANKVIDR